MLRTIALFLVSSIALAQETRFNPFRGKEMPIVPYSAQYLERLKYYQECEKRWTLSGSDYDDFFRSVVGSEHTEKSLYALVQVLQKHPNPKNAEIILRVLSETKIEDRGTHFQFLKTLADGFSDQEAWQRSLLVAGTDSKMLAIIDGAAIRAPFPNAAWWLSERIRLNQLETSQYRLAFEVIGRYGTSSDVREAVQANAKSLSPRISEEAAQKALEVGAKQRPSVAVSESRSRPSLVLENTDLWKMNAGADLRKLNADTETAKIKLENAGYLTDLSSTNDTVVLNALQQLNARSIKPGANDLLPIILDPKREAKVRKEARASLPGTAELVASCRKIIDNAKSSADRRNHAIQVLLEAKPIKLLDLIYLQELLPKQDGDGQKLIALAMAASQEGAELLLASVQSGKVKAAIVTDATVVEKLKLAKVHDLDERLKNLRK